MTRRAAIVLAIVAALHGAPSPLFAAPPGQLDASTVPAARDVDDLLLVLGIVVGVAAVALSATGWLLAGRTRDDERGPAARGTRGSRARRRARAAGHDPVLEAMGLNEEAPPPSPDG